MCRKPKKVKLQECIEILRNLFSKFDDHRAFSDIPLSDFLMTSFAIFSLKYPSLLNFENAMKEDKRKDNLKSLFGISKVPSDTHLRDIMDVVDTDQFRVIFKKFFTCAQRNKLLENYEFLRIGNQPHYLISSDGTGYFRSDKVGCISSNNYDGGEKKRLNKYGHNMLGVSLVHPNRQEVIPLCPEPVIAQDGNTKNDCELNAFKRFLPKFRQDHPKLSVIMSLDALYSTEPPIKLMFEHDCSFIIVVKETNGTVFRQINDGEVTGETLHHEYSYEIGDKVKKQVIHRYRYMSNIHLNQDPRSTRVNFLEFWEEINWEGKKGPETKRTHYAWITDLKVNKETIVQLAKGGRARWKIENETFNTLKNQGYNFEHNYGHGKNNLSVNFIMIMFLAFLVDQIQQASCQSFQKALGRYGSKKMLWTEMASQFRYFFFANWDHFFQFLNKEAVLKAEIIYRSG
jgi:hypothetical protein